MANKADRFESSREGRRLLDAIRSWVLDLVEAGAGGSSRGTALLAREIAAAQRGGRRPRRGAPR
jgi:hypothetical protein